MQERARDGILVRPVHSECVPDVAAAQPVADFQNARHVRVVERKHSRFKRLPDFEGLRLRHVGAVGAPLLPIYRAPH